MNAQVGRVKGGSGFFPHNAWMADGEKMVDEQLEVTVARDGSANVIDLVWTGFGARDIAMTCAFGGFCVRVLEGEEAGCVGAGWKSEFAVAESYEAGDGLAGCEMGTILLLPMVARGWR